MPARVRRLGLQPILICILCLLVSHLDAIVGSSTWAAAKDWGECADCHEQVAAAFDVSFHGRLWRLRGKTRSCGSCHGGTDKHLTEPSSQNIIVFSRKSSRDVQLLTDRCMSCHSLFSSLKQWNVEKHNRNGVTCVDCHVIHSADNRIPEPDICLGCHKAVRLQINKQSHHPIVERKVKCSDCHAPHGSLSNAMIRAESINKLCYKCHADKRGPFLWEHPPVEEDCTICHLPHGSQHSKLLTAKIPNLCQDCHNWTGHPGVANQAANRFSGSSPSNLFFARACLNCHGTIHGSIAPVNPGGTNVQGRGKAFTR